METKHGIQTYRYTHERTNGATTMSHLEREDMNTNSNWQRVLIQQNIKCITALHLIHRPKKYPFLVRFYSAANAAYHNQDSDDKKADDSAKYSDHNSSKHIIVMVVVVFSVTAADSNINLHFIFGNILIYLKDWWKTCINFLKIKFNLLALISITVYLLQVCAEVTSVAVGKITPLERE